MDIKVQITDLYSLSSSEIVEHICDGIYKEDTCGII